MDAETRFHFHYIEALLRLVLKGERALMADLSELTASVTRIDDVQDSAVALLNGLAASHRCPHSKYGICAVTVTSAA